VADGHAGHDLELVASLLDGDLRPEDRARAARQVANCADCASIQRDLLALSAATRALPTPARTRDFRLTAVDAARLAAAPPEPIAASTRPAVDMQTTTDHATHDLERLSAAVDGTLPAAALPAIDAQLASCAECADLHADLLAIVAANRALATPPRPHDYRLTDADAKRLQPGGLRGWLARVGSPKDRVSRPLAIGLTTLGLVGVLVGTAPSLLLFGSASSSGAAAGAPTRDNAAQAGDGVASAGPSAAASAAAGAAAPIPEGASEPPAAAAASSAPVKVQVDDASPGQRDPNASVGSDAQAGAGQPDLAAPPAGSPTFETLTADRATDSGPSLVLVASLAALLAGIALFVLRLGARRRRGA
jgi:anti-sigma factor RsiW